MEKYKFNPTLNKELLNARVCRLNMGGADRLLITTRAGDTYIIGYKQPTYRVEKGVLVKDSFIYPGLIDDVKAVYTVDWDKKYLHLNIGTVLTRPLNHNQIYMDIQ